MYRKPWDALVDLALIARQSGLLALEEKAEEIKEPFFKQAVVMIVDANDPDKVRASLEHQVEDMMTRHEEAKGLLCKGIRSGAGLRYDRNPGRSGKHVKGYGPFRFRRRSQYPGTGHGCCLNHHLLRFCHE